MKAIRQEHNNHRRLHLILDELDIETTDFITKPAHEQQRLVTEFLTRVYGDDIKVEQLNDPYPGHTSTYISGHCEFNLEFHKGSTVRIITLWNNGIERTTWYRMNYGLSMNSLKLEN